MWVADERFYREVYSCLAIALRQAGADGFIARPFAPEGGTIEKTIVALGSEVWPRVCG